MSTKALPCKNYEILIRPLYISECNGLKAEKISKALGLTVTNRLPYVSYNEFETFEVLTKEQAENLNFINIGQYTINFDDKTSNKFTVDHIIWEDLFPGEVTEEWETVNTTETTQESVLVYKFSFDWRKRFLKDR